MSNEALEKRPVSVLNVVAWTLGPLALFVVVMKGVSFLPFRSRAGVWLTLLVFLSSGIGQCIAYAKSRTILKGQPIAVRIVGYLCILFSTILIFMWFGMLMFVGLYATHPNAPMIFGGR